MNRRSFVVGTILLPLAWSKRANAGRTPCDALPPSDLRAEQGVLGALLSDSNCYGDVWFLFPKHFADPVHGFIYAAIVGKILSGRTADLAAMRTYFEGSRVLDEVGGASYLDQLLPLAAEDVAADGRAIHATWRERVQAHIS